MIKWEISINKTAFAVICAFARKKRMRIQLLSMNDVAYRVGAISETEYEEMSQSLEGYCDT